MNTNTKKLSLIAIIAVAIIASVFTINETNNTEHIVVEPSNVPKPNEIPFYQGVMMLQAYEIQDPRAFHDVSIQDYPWIQRVVEGEQVIVNHDEVNQFFALAEDDVYYFKVTLPNSDTGFYHITYSDVRIDLDQHYLKATHIENPRSDIKKVDANQHDWLKKIQSDPYHWIPISDSQIDSYKAFIAIEGNKVSTAQGNFNILYVGPDTPELKLPQYRHVLVDNKADLAEVDD